MVDLSALLRDMERAKGRHPSSRQSPIETHEGPVRYASAEDLDRLRAAREEGRGEE